MDSSSGSDNAALGFMAAYFGILGIIALAFLALFIWIYWRILSRAGFSGALALLCLVPGVGALIPILILAFGRWPRISWPRSRPAIRCRTPIRTRSHPLHPRRRRDRPLRSSLARLNLGDPFFDRVAARRKDRREIVAPGRGDRDVVFDARADAA